MTLEGAQRASHGPLRRVVDEDDREEERVPDRLRRPRAAAEMQRRAASRRAPHPTDTGFEHHGFLNVLLAVDAVAGGATTEGVARVLAQRDPVTVAEQVARLPDDVQAVRAAP